MSSTVQITLQLKLQGQENACRTVECEWQQRLTCQTGNNMESKEDHETFFTVRV